jgi:hypothetical protein
LELDYYTLEGKENVPEVIWRYLGRSQIINSWKATSGNSERVTVWSRNTNGDICFMYIKYWS